MRETAPMQTQVLDDVRRALGHESTITPQPLEPFIESLYPADSTTVVDRFITEAESLGCRVYLVETLRDVGDRVSEICAGCDGGVVLSSSTTLEVFDLKQHLESKKISLTSIESFQNITKQDLVARLASTAVGITGVEFAIAETGTVMLTSDEEQSLLLSLLPPIHIAILKTHQIEQSLGTVIDKLETGWIGREPAARSATFITGPSRTSDVELTLSIGVHGPKELHLIITS